MTVPGRPRLVVAGLSTRAMAASAARAGYAVTAIDAFADLDQAPGVQAFSLPRDAHRRWSPRAAAHYGRAIHAPLAAYGSGFENEPEAVGVLREGRELLGNSPTTVRRVRNPMLVSRMLVDAGLAAPTTREVPPDAGDMRVVRQWLVKRRASGGGGGVAAWRRGDALSPATYLQERIDGTPGSIAFVGDGTRAAALAVTRQLVGDRAFGGNGFRYCGNIIAPVSDPHFDRGAELAARAAELAREVTRRFHLVGANGIDFVARDGVPYPIEVNPRWTASMELLERRSNLSLFTLHVAGCRGALPEAAGGSEARGAQPRVPAVGKAVVYARHGMTAGETRSWLDDPSVHDVPHPGEHIASGRPICTVFAEGADAAACYVRLVARAARVYAEIGTHPVVVA